MELDTEKLFLDSYTNIEGFTYCEEVGTTPLPVKPDEIRALLDTAAKAIGSAQVFNASSRLEAVAMTEILAKEEGVSEEARTTQGDTLARRQQGLTDIKHMGEAGACIKGGGYEALLEGVGAADELETVMRQMQNYVQTNLSGARNEAIVAYVFETLEQVAREQGIEVKSPERKSAIEWFARQLGEAINEGKVNPADILQFLSRRGINLDLSDEVKTLASGGGVYVGR